MIKQDALDREISRLLNILYEKRFAKLDEIDLKRLLKKNPYLFRSIGLNDSSELIEAMLDAFLSSSDETLFGNDFFEPLAFWTAKNAVLVDHEKRESVTVGSASGTDLAIETANSYLAIAVKSGTNIFNSQSTKGQSTEFLELKSRLRKLGKEIRPIIGYGYGRNKAAKASKTEKHAGQAFWYLLSGEKDFYLRISDSIGKFALEHRQQYMESYKRTKNRLLKQLAINFVDDSGELNWHKIVEYNSSIDKPCKLLEPTSN
ncbi:PmeII family type II restriction endonuclease [Oceanospirillum linum]|uniref:Type II restriction endonuclease EcoO109IR domain-containing protein n=1 Tax=Oceanospirillum linum TaxID=966 RepID=A0A1T1H9Z8_OCELI|nr:PmeII family type II restriction endonuclease [Oceanospirillum linum]OOV86691.1 hypothetical protein BTA35_0212515 [Oceanospirillum linum]SEG26130.1 Type II restriction endonuclease EcoO109I [Oleiphilus messinensis]SMP27887.1 Type II restriction endonuclease EcoO109I [Oceanospirillum linum]